MLFLKHLGEGWESNACLLPGGGVKSRSHSAHSYCMLWDPHPLQKKPQELYLQHTLRWAHRVLLVCSCAVWSAFGVTFVIAVSWDAFLLNNLWVRTDRQKDLSHTCDSSRWQSECNTSIFLRFIYFLLCVWVCFTCMYVCDHMHVWRPQRLEEGICQIYFQVNKCLFSC